MKFTMIRRITALGLILVLAAGIPIQASSASTEKVTEDAASTKSLQEAQDEKAQLEKALRKKVWLKSGGSLIIEPTEALTVIDVNTGKSISGKHSKELHYQKTNREAALEIARQIRLRNLSGIILIDFINMKSEEANHALMRQMQMLLQEDPVPAQVIDRTALGLVEITRKKISKCLADQLTSD